MAKEHICAVGFRTKGIIGEAIYDPQAHTTSFLVKDMQNKEIKQVNKWTTDTGRTFVPYCANHSLIKNKVLRLPSEQQDFGDVSDLIAQIKHHIHTYVDLSEAFETISAHYILLIWLQDTHDILPYLRIRGSWGSGKTRFLNIIGSLCYRALFVSGAASVAALFRMLNDVEGTLVLDEGDFSHTSERAEIVKILNNGNAKGFPVLRCEKNNQNSFEPHSYNIFGAKILASRGRFDDDALESRFVTEESSVKKLRTDIPLALDEHFHVKSMQLRNKLLAFRFDHYANAVKNLAPTHSGLSHRSLQIITPLLQFMDEQEKKLVINYLEIEDAKSLRDQAMELPSQILTCIRNLQTQNKKLQIGAIRKELLRLYSHYYEYGPTAHTVGKVVRTQLQLKTKSVGGIFVIPKEQYPKIDYLYEKLGLNQE